MGGRKVNGTVNTYNVYRDGNLIREEANCRQAARLSGCDAGQISAYANHNSTFAGTDGDYTYSITNSEKRHKYTPTEKRIFNEEKQLDIPKWLETDWNNMRTAAKLLKTGHGRIVSKCVKGKYIKYVEVIM